MCAVKLHIRQDLFLIQILKENWSSAGFRKPKPSSLSTSNVHCCKRKSRKVSFMTELREVRTRKISSPSSSLIFPPSQQKKRKTAIRAKRKIQNVKNYWNSSSGFSATLHASDCGWILRLVILLHLLIQPSSLPTPKKKTRKKTKKTRQKIQKKRAQTKQKNSLRLSLDLLLLLLVAVSIRIARDSCRAREIAEKCNQNAHENDHAAPQRNEAIAEPISIMAVIGVKGD